MIRVSNIKVDVIKNDYISALINKLKIKKEDIIKYEIYKKSIDARKEVNYIYTIDVYLKNEKIIKLNNEVILCEKEKYEYKPLTNKKDNIVVVGMGPAGLFCAYELCKNGYNVTIIERGEKIEDRIKSVEKFWNTNDLNTSSNIQFGEGGAGTFSDGKLTTGIKDKNNRIVEVLDTFIENGAPEEIKYLHMPHIGTDNLRIVIKNMREKIISMGGNVLFNSCMTDINIKDNKIDSVVINNDKTIKCDKLVLALGHSARDTFRMLNEKGLLMANKPFAVGFRVCHNQEFIDKNQYGKYYKYLNHASYKLTYNSNGRGVYSFCMCPGGYVINASSEKEGLAINGMSNYKRDSGISNSAIIISVNEKDYGTNLFDGVKYQEELEHKAYKLCNGKIPIQLLIDYKKCIKSNKLGSVIPAVKGDYSYADLNSLLSKELNDTIKSSFDYFNTKIKGFSNYDTVLLGIESRTSSPIRIIRDDNFESNIKGIYPCGEGAGYAGGITSAAVDGIKIFEAITKI